jgi:peptide/nickel transport system ATP-binding protein
MPSTPSVLGAQIAEPIRVHQGSGAEAEERVRLTPDEVGLGAEAAVRFPHELSGGQRLRAAWRWPFPAIRFPAGGRPTRPDVLIQAEIADLLEPSGKKDGMALVTHDFRRRPASVNDLRLRRGKLVETLRRSTWLGARSTQNPGLVKALLEMEGWGRRA